MSSYEDIISKILKNNNISYNREVSYADLRNGKFRFDFMVHLKQEDVLLEIDGQGHFMPIFGSSKLKLQQGYDRRKNSYALANKIKLYRIPYWDLDNKKCKSYWDLFNPEYLVKDKFHNDTVWREHQKNISS